MQMRLRQRSFIIPWRLLVVRITTNIYTYKCSQRLSPVSYFNTTFLFTEKMTSMIEMTAVGSSTRELPADDLG